MSKKSGHLLGLIKTIAHLYDTEEMDWADISEEVEDRLSMRVLPSKCKQLYSKYEHYIETERAGIEPLPFPNLEIPEVKLDLTNERVKSITKKVEFIDIETSLLDAKVFRTGLQNVNASQLTSTTRILTVAGGSMYDLLTKGEKGIWGLSNHESPSFKESPLDDTDVLKAVWDKLDNAEVVVAHNARFDKGWLFGRFLENGWRIPSKFSLVCTYQNLWEYNLTSKKLQELSKSLIGTEKIQTDLSLWMRCADGEKAAFEEMLRYNKGDIYDTLFKVYIRTCQYNPSRAIDMTDYSTSIPQCRVTGQVLEKLGKKYLNRTNGLYYYLYRNPVNGLQYIDRYNTGSRKSNIGLIRHHR